MTSRPVPPKLSTSPADRFPDFPPREDMQNPIHLHDQGHQAALRRHLGAPDTTIVLGEVPVGRNVSQRQGLRIPDLLMAFGVDRAGIIDQRGYSIDQWGKPPDFVLEVASEGTGQYDIAEKRADYAAFGIPEYWRFDPSGGQYHGAPMAGDRLVGGAYRSIPIESSDDVHFRGRSQTLGLDLCWEDGRLRWYDPVARRYLLTFDETDDARLAAEEERDAERRIRLAAEEQVRDLEAEIRRLRD